MTIKYFNVKNGLTTGNISLNAGNSNITASTYIGNIRVTSSANLGSVSNVTITGGSSGYLLSTDGSGNLTWVGQSLSAAAINNGTSNVTITTSGGNVTTSVAGNANILVVTGTGANINGTLNATGNVVGANLNATGIVYGNNNIVVGSTSGEGGQIVVGWVGVNGMSGQANGTWNMDVDSSNNFRLFTQNATGVVSGITMTAYSGNNNTSFAGNVSAPYFIGNGSQLTGITVSAGSSITNGTSNVVVDSSGNVRTSVAGTANVMVVSSTTVSAPIFAATDNGNGTNFKVGDDAWLGDINTADTIGIKGQQNAANAYIVFGNADSTGKLGRAGTGPLTYAGSFTASGNVSAAYFIGDGGLLSNITASAGSSIVNGNSNVTVTGNGNVLISSAGNANVVVVTGTGINVAGTINSTGNANVGNIGATNGVFTNVSGNGSSLSSITGANVTGAVSYATTANSVAGANVSGQVGNALVASTVYTAAQPNITSVGTLSNLNVSGNTVIGGNLTVDGNLVYVNVTDLSVEDPIIQLQTGPNAAPPTSNSGKDVGTALNYYDTSAKIAFMGWDVSNAEFGFGNTVSISSEVVTFTSYGNVRAGYFIGNGSQLTGVTSATSANYIANGTSNVNISTSGGNVTIGVSGNANIVTVTGTGANINGTLNVTGNAIVGNLSGGDIVSANYITGTLTTGSQPNVTSVGTLTGLTSNGIINFTNSSNVSLGPVGNIRITGGTSGYVLQTDGTGNLAWSTVSTISNGNSNVSIPSANGNINISSGGNANIVVVSDTGVTISGNIVTEGADGNLTGANYIIANFFSGNGSALSALTGANVTGQVGNALVAGTVYTAAQPNITSVGTLTGLTSNGVVNFANTSNLTLGAVGNIHITGGTANYVLSTDGSGNLSWVAQTGGGTGASISNGTSNVTIATSGGNVTTSVAGNANVFVVTGTGANIVGYANVTGNVNAGNVNATTFTGTLSGAATTAGTVTTAAQPNITSVGLLTGLSVGPNSSITLTGSSGYVKANSIQGTDGVNAIYPGYDGVTGAVGVTSNLTVGVGVAGHIIANGNITANYITGIFTTSASAQPNITSVGTLSNLTSIGNVDFTGADNVSLGAVGNISITGGTANYVLSTDGSGNLSWVAQSGGGGGASISNGTSNVNIATSGGNVTTGVGGNANILVVTGTGANVNGYLTVSGDTALGNVGNVSITGGSNGYVLSTDGSGNLSWIAGSASGVTITVDDFTGDGTNTAFTLSVSPTNEDYTLVSLAGTFQPRTTYSLAGSTLTFSSAPPNNAPIEVTVFSSSQGMGPGGSNTQVQFNDDDSFSGDANLTFDKTTGTLNALNITANNAPVATTGKAIAMAIVFGF